MGFFATRAIDAIAGDRIWLAEEGNDCLATGNLDAKFILERV